MIHTIRSGLLFDCKETYPYSDIFLKRRNNTKLAALSNWDPKSLR